MIYKTRPGIIMTKICGVVLLVPTREASEVCPYIKRLSLLSSIIWETIEKDLPMENAREAFKIILRKSDEAVDEKIQNIIDDFCDNNYLIREEVKNP